MTKKGVSFTAARRICLVLISPWFPTVTRQKELVRREKGKGGGGGGDLGLGTLKNTSNN